VTTGVLAADFLFSVENYCTAYFAAAKWGTSIAIGPRAELEELRHRLYALRNTTLL
jgi:hypothetical protein